MSRIITFLCSYYTIQESGYFGGMYLERTFMGSKVAGMPVVGITKQDDEKAEVRGGWWRQGHINVALEVPEDFDYDSLNGKIVEIYAGNVFKIINPVCDTASIELPSLTSDYQFTTFEESAAMADSITPRYEDL